MKKETLKQEIARDTIALGGLTFYILVIARALIAPYYDFVWKILIGLVFVFIVGLIFKKFDKHMARFVILAVFTSMFYNVFNFYAFVGIVSVLVLVSSFYLRRSKLEVLYGIVIGGVGVLISWLFVGLIV